MSFRVWPQASEQPRSGGSGTVGIRTRTTNGFPNVQESLAAWPNHAGTVVAPRQHRRADRGPDPAATLEEIASATCAEADLSRYNERNDSTPDPGDPGDPNERTNQEV